ncbi:MAG: endonuclease/exonuclease/phosphatase family protein, partial [Gammaproteobacteria bacterium]|nr:endonuclease/exonuclease/phosphatase family protein [Gammaproteobacteria bacterium]
LHELRAVIETDNVDVFLLQETKLDSCVTDGELRIPGYSLIRRDRNRSGGGLAVYAKAALNPIKLHCPTGIEILPVKLNCKRNTLTVCSVYKPPQQNRNNFAEDLCEFVASLGQHSSRTVLAGDFNVCAFVQTEYACLQPLSCTFSLRQHISEAIHDRRCIDLLFTGSELNVFVHGLAAPIEKKHAVT